MVAYGEKDRETIRPEFDRSIVMDFEGAQITSNTGFLLLGEIDEREAQEEAAVDCGR